MNPFLLALIGFVLGYVFGAIPVGYFVGKAYGVDVRQHGSGRTGGSNVLRTIGWGAFFVTIAGDALKGVLPVLILRARMPSEVIAPAFAVIGVCVGNNWSLFIAWLTTPPSIPANASILTRVGALFARARGGVGVVVTAGAAVALYYPPVLILLPVGLGMLLIFRYSSLASTTIAVLYPLVMAYFVLSDRAPLLYLFVSVVVSAIGIYALSPNLKRLIAGTESKFGQRLNLS